MREEESYYSIILLRRGREGEEIWFDLDVYVKEENKTRTLYLYKMKNIVL